MKDISIFWMKKKRLICCYDASGDNPQYVLLLFLFYEKLKQNEYLSYLEVYKKE